MGSRRSEREVVVTGAGVLCHLGGDPTEIETLLREGRTKPFAPFPPGVENNARCQIAGLYPGELTDDDIGVSKAQGRFMGRQARAGAWPRRGRRLAQSGLTSREMAVVVGSGAGDVRTHVEISRSSKRRTTCAASSRRWCRGSWRPPCRPISSTSSAPRVRRSRAAACAGGAYNLLLAAMLIQGGHCDRALAGGCEQADPHFHAGFDSMRAYNADDNDRPERASRPYAADRAGFIFAEGAGLVVLETREAAEARGATVLGVLRGWGMSSDGEGDMVAPSSDGARRAMELRARARRTEPGRHRLRATRTARPRPPATWARSVRSAACCASGTCRTRRRRATRDIPSRPPVRLKRSSRCRCCAAGGWRRRFTPGQSIPSWRTTRRCSTRRRCR